MVFSLTSSRDIRLLPEIERSLARLGRNADIFKDRQAGKDMGDLKGLGDANLGNLVHLLFGDIFSLEEDLSRPSADKGRTKD